MKESEKEELEALLTSAKKVLVLVEESTLEHLEENLESYLNNFRLWQERFERNEHQIEDTALVSLLEELQLLHQQVVEKVNIKKDDILLALQEIHKRGKAVKAYIDRYPSRITITGKREG